MLDSDVAMLYHYKIKRINETVRRNKERFLINNCWIKIEGYQIMERTLKKYLMRYKKMKT